MSLRLGRRRILAAQAISIARIAPRVAVRWLNFGEAHTVKRIALAVVLVVSVSAPAWAGFDEGLAAYDGGDYETALREWKPLAEQGDAQTQTRVGSMYATGDGVPKDYPEAARWYQKAAEQGNAEAQVALGNMHYTCGREIISLCASTTPVYPDYTEAVKWYRKAAEQSNAIAQLYLGRMYVAGQGVPQDYVLAHKWLNLAAAQKSTVTKERDLVAAKMTPGQIAEAQRLAREWKPKKE